MLDLDNGIPAPQAQYFSRRALCHMRNLQPLRGGFQGNSAGTGCKTRLLVTYGSEHDLAAREINNEVESLQDWHTKVAIQQAIPLVTGALSLQRCRYRGESGACDLHTAQTRQPLFVHAAPPARHRAGNHTFAQEIRPVPESRIEHCWPCITQIEQHPGRPAFHLDGDGPIVSCN